MLKCGSLSEGLFLEGTIDKNRLAAAMVELERMEEGLKRIIEKGFKTIGSNLALVSGISAAIATARKFLIAAGKSVEKK